MTKGEPSKMSGKSDEAIGSIKTNVGKVFGNAHLQGEGQAQHARGEGEVAAAAAKKHAEASGESLKGNVNSVLGQLTGDHGKHAAGETQKAHAEAQHRAA